MVNVGGLPLPLDPVIWLLGLVERVIPAKHTQLFVLYSAFYAHREILLCWKASNSPTVLGLKMAIKHTSLIQIDLRVEIAHTNSIKFVTAVLMHKVSLFNVCLSDTDLLCTLVWSGFFLSLCLPPMHGSDVISGWPIKMTGD